MGGGGGGGRSGKIIWSAGGREFDPRLGYYSRMNF